MLLQVVSAMESLFTICAALCLVSLHIGTTYGAGELVQYVIGCWVRGVWVAVWLYHDRNVTWKH